MLLGILGHVTDDGRARSIVGRLVEAMPAGSYLVVSDGSNVVKGDRGQAGQDDYNDSGAEPYCLRSPEQITRFFDGLDLVAPGVVSVSRWRPGAGDVPEEIDAFCGVGLKR